VSVACPELTVDFLFKRFKISPFEDKGLPAAEFNCCKQAAKSVLFPNTFLLE
jgi:hypothetical protein